MENKEVIIDGVNVAGCEFLDEWKHCNICQELIKTVKNPINGKYRTQCLDTQDLECAFYKNCHYKQLQRKEQECEKLRDIIETKFEQENLTDTALTYINDRYIYLKRDYKCLQAENEELKNHIKSKEQLGDDCDFCKYNNKSECYAKANIEFAKESNRYKQALEQVNEISKDKIKWCEQGKRYCNKCKCICNEYKILTIINEVLKDE